MFFEKLIMKLTMSITLVIFLIALATFTMAGGCTFEKFNLSADKGSLVVPKKDVPVVVP